MCPLISCIGTLHFRHVTCTPASHRSPSPRDSAGFEQAALDLAAGLLFSCLSAGYFGILNGLAIPRCGFSHRGWGICHKNRSSEIMHSPRGSAKHRSSVWPESRPGSSLRRTKSFSSMGHAPDKNYILVRLDARGEHAFSTVYHEYTHYILRKAEWLPLWLNEGLAQFYENTDIDEKTVWLGQANAQELRFLGRTDLLPMETLLKVDTRLPYRSEESREHKE